MKNFLKISSIFALVALVVSSCDRDEPTLGEPFLNVSENQRSWNLPREGTPAERTATIDVESNRSWRITVTNHSVEPEEWFRITPSSLEGENNGRITVILENNPGAQRRVDLTLVGAGRNPVMVTIVQEGDGTLQGDGTEQNPFTVAQVIRMIEDATMPGTRVDVWVKGYIIGGVASTLTDGGNRIENPSDVVFGVTGIRNSAIMLADSPNETNFTQTIPVQLPTGLIRDEVNLVGNPGNLGRELAIRGNLVRYFAVPGVNPTTDHRLFGDTPPPPPPTDPDPVSALAEDFQSFRSGSSNVFMGDQTDSRGWRGVNVQGSLEADVRSSDGNIFVHFSAHRTSGVNVGDLQEFWLISPRLDLNAATAKTLSFEMRNGHHNANSVFSVYVLDADDTDGTGTRTELTGWTRPPVNTGSITGATAWTPSGQIDLSAHSGVVRIGFFYSGTSGSGNSSTYQLDNFVFGDAQIAPPPPPPAEHEITDTLAAWVFSSATNLNNLTATFLEGLITRNIETALSFTGSDRTIWCSGWNAVGRYWLITIPADRELSGDVIVNFRTRGTATSPRDWRMQVSSDNTNWTDGETYTVAEAIGNRSVKATLPAPIASGGTVYIRLVTTSTTSIGGGTAAPGGNSRLADVTVGL